MKKSNNLEIIFWRFLALILLILLSPIFFILSFVIVFSSGWPFFFIQKRVGYMGRVFRIYKFRTMINGAEKVKEKLMDKNEADGPVFKIRNDPRFTRVGSFLCHSGLDELPQILNIVKGDMVFIGPRPLPVDEASQIDDKYRTVRESVLPGLISPWILNGYHKMSFDSWMKSDMEYIEKKTFKGDIFSFFKGAVFVAGLLESELLEK